MIIIHGKRVERKPLGWTLFDCPRCMCIQPFFVETNVQKSHLYYIDLPDVVSGNFVTCDFCDACFVLTRNQKPPIDSKWKRTDSLELLAKTAKPDYDPKTKKNGWSNNELIAALISMQEKGSANKFDTSIGCFIGGIAGAISSFCIGKILYALGIRFEMADEAGNQILFVLIGGGLGLIFGSLISQLKQSKASQTKALSDFMAKHKVPIKSLIQAASTSKLNLNKILRICNNEIRFPKINT
jgi:hypothetical protein